MKADDIMQSSLATGFLAVTHINDFPPMPDMAMQPTEFEELQCAVGVVVREGIQA